ncbi:hypothetical protein D7V64_02050 [Acinetobacter cumulans]|uniref:SCP2 domain-containing protein n=1 Tax=Acinetobacter cumulans TaxID=2136182 RepID=A0A3A8G8B4_9GAMM|nr:MULTISPECIES: hypothetical protein [Acinetobacter]NWK73010.1 hypothetical protein [Acinetobacter sp. SwsAc6]QCO21952.1 hypothetical protein C9E88_010895 [Acinetobacter cumulans]RKG45863.1 hypothetical protein D7V51_04250 [Acinetobacter cumulans]RKG47533.1 hypothetical protein D7V68_11265 [Acinetobacter cumulans]RKG55125.1 hypothetical protein D7V64_02050 [Acinetobacter cumulans]
MSDAQQRKDQTHLLLTMTLIVLETVFSFILKHDRVVALQAKKFVDQKIAIKINSYIPYFDFYVQFSDHGILFDEKAPEKAVDLDVRTTLMDLIKIFIFGNRRSIKGMRIDGDIVLKDEFRDLLSLFSLPKLLSDWKHWLSEAPNDQDITASKKRIAPLLEKIDQQRSKINTLQVEVKQYKNRIKRIERRQKRINLIFTMITVLLIVLLVYNVWPA